jgi:hypothetical protein
VSACVAVFVLLGFLGSLFLIPESRTSSWGKVPIDAPLLDYGFGPNKSLLVFDLSGPIEDEEGLANVTFYRDGSVRTDASGDPLKEVPIGLEQKGGVRPQINLKFEFRKVDDPAEDDDREVWDGYKLEDYFLRGCWKEPGCFRDLAPTVLHGTPPLQCEMVEVVFARDGLLTYEGVYLLCAGIKRRFFHAALAWEAKGKKPKDCGDDFGATALLFESEYTRPGRTDHSSDESALSIDMKYPKQDFYVDEDGDFVDCPEYLANVTDRAYEWYRVPLLLNRTVAALDRTTFAQMYVGTQLLQQVDFGFRGAQQYYYVPPHTGVLHTGPMYDFDSEWDLCGDVDTTPDVVTCHGEAPSPLWVALGNEPAFSAELRAHGRTLLDDNLRALRVLNARQVRYYDAGYFARQEARWPVRGRAYDLVYHLWQTGRTHKVDSGDTLRAELLYQMDYYERRARAMNRTLATVDGFTVTVSQTRLYLLGLEMYWWFVLLFPLSVLSCVIQRRPGSAAPPPPPPRTQSRRSPRRPPAA